MRQENSIKHQFVEFIPEQLDEATLYVSMRFATVSHHCACGCKTKVVTPLKPTDWKLTFDGKTITLYPSIGNWSFPCRSHYWIKNSRVQWAEDWSQERVDTNRAYDRSQKDKYYVPDKEEATPRPETPAPGSPKTAWWKKLWPW